MSLFVLELKVPVVPQLGLLFLDLGFTPPRQQFSPCTPHSLPWTPRSACPLYLGFCHLWSPNCEPNMLVSLSHLIHITTLGNRFLLPFYK